MTFWSPLFCAALFLFLTCIGNLVARKTKGYISSILVICLIYLAGFTSGIFPRTVLADSGFVSFAGSIGMAFMLCHMGTTINLAEFVREWKTVVIALFGLAGLLLISLTLGQFLFGRDYALAAVGPVAGAMVAALVVVEQAAAAARADLGAFAVLIISFQLFIGVPIASFCLRRECLRLQKNKESLIPVTASGKQFSLKFLPDPPAQWETPAFIILRLAICCALGFWAAELSGGWLNRNVAYLIFGILFAEFGFLARNSLDKAKSVGLINLAVIAIIPSNMSDLTLADLGNMIVPVWGMMIIGAIGIAIGSIIVGKLLKTSVPMSIAIGISAMLGYPPTQVVTNEVVDRLSGVTEEERENIRGRLMPRMLVSGFTTVTIASVFVASIACKILFG